jgi:phage protein D
VDGEISGGRTGPQTLRKAFGDLPGRRIRDVPVAEAEARALARAEMLRRSRGFVQVRGTTAGSPQLVVGSRVTLARCGRPFDGDGYYVTRVRHSFDLATGLRTRFTAERPTVNAR